MVVSTVPAKSANTPPPESVTITMTGEEAFLLRQVLGAISGPAQGKTLHFEHLSADPRTARVVTDTLWHALCLDGLRYEE